jgi:hypothetical protein
MATGGAFVDAENAIVPLMRPDNQNGHSTIFSIASAP